MDQDSTGGARAHGELGAARDTFIARFNATFGFAAGLADVCRRARRAGQVPPAHQVPDETPPGEFAPGSPD